MEEDDFDEINDQRKRSVTFNKLKPQSIPNSSQNSLNEDNEKKLKILHAEIDISTVDLLDYINSKTTAPEDKVTFSPKGLSDSHTQQELKKEHIDMSMDEIQNLESTDTIDGVLKENITETKHIKSSTKDSSFSWYKDDDDPLNISANKRKRLGCCGRTILRVGRFPNIIRTMLYTLIGYFLFMPLEDNSLYFNQMRPNQLKYFSIDGYPFFTFSVYLSLSWTSFFWLRYLFCVLPDLLVRLIDFIAGDALSEEISEEIAHNLDYLKHLKSYLTLFIWSVTNYICWQSIFVLETREWQAQISLILLTTVFATGIWLLEKTLLQVFAVHFHKIAYRDRVLNIKAELHIIDQLNKIKAKRKPIKSNSPAKMKSKSYFSRKSDMNGDFSSIAKDCLPVEQNMIPSEVVIPIEQDKTNEPDEERRESFSKKTIESMGFMSVFSSAVGFQSSFPMSTGVILRNKFDAKKLAKKLFEALSDGNDSITLSDFEMHFRTTEEAQKAFQVFDKDNSNFISKNEMKMTLLHIYYEHSAIEKSMRQSSQAIKKLDSILKSFVLLIIAFVCLGVWNVNISSFLTVAVSIWAGILFAVGKSISTLVQNILFLFVVHPFDVGDCIEFNGQIYIVKEFGLNATVLKMPNGKEIYSPNERLSLMDISNIRRSGNQSEEIVLKLLKTTTFIKLSELKQGMISWLENEESREFSSKIDFKIKELVGNTLVVACNLEHKSNWQDSGAKSNRRNRFMWKIKELIEELKIEMAKADDQ